MAGIMSIEGERSIIGSDQEENKNSPGRTREVWTRKREYILSLLGYSVGIGSLWRFPYLCNRNGGGAFLIPYVIAILTCAMPIFFLEVSIGQFSSRSALHVWEICPLFKGIGTTQFVTTFFSVIPYNLVIAWSIYYLIKSFWPVLPWTTCDNWWNTPLCVNKLGNLTTLNSTYFDNAVGNQRLMDSTWRKPNTTLTASEEFWQYSTLRVSSGLDDVGSVQLHLLLCVFGAWAIVFLCVVKGVQSVGKVVYVTAVLPYILLTVLLVRSCMMPGAGDGILYLLKLDMSRLLSVQVWLEALLQAFYSVSATFGSLITMSSYSKFHNNCVRDVVIVTIIGEASSIFCALVVFSTLGFMAHQAHVPVSEVVSSGAGLGFIIYPEALAQLPVPQLWAVLFFLTLITVGIDSMFACVETSIAGIIEAFPTYLRHRRVLVAAAVCFVSFLLSIPYTTAGGLYVFQLLEWYFVSFSALLVGCLECIGINWIYGSERFSRDFEMMLGRRPPALLRLCTTFLTPLILFVALILSLFMYDPPSYGEYVYPEYAKVIGILLTVMLAIPIPIQLVYRVLKQKGSVCERFRDAGAPTSKWAPYRPEDRLLYRRRNREFLQQKKESLDIPVKLMCSDTS